MRNVIVHSRRGPTPGDRDALRGFGVATVHEAMGRRGLLAPEIRPIYAGSRIAGRAVTVLSHPGDNLMIHASIEMCSPGDILVVATTSRSTDGMFGELFATQLRHREVAGLVTDAGVRDIAELTAMGFPAWSRAVHAQGTAKAVAGSVNVPVVIAGQDVAPGDVIVADDDGVVCVPLDVVPTIVDAARDREKNEADKRRMFTEGVLGVDVYDLRAKLRELGVVYIDEQGSPEREGGR